MLALAVLMGALSGERMAAGQHRRMAGLSNTSWQQGLPTGLMHSRHTCKAKKAASSDPATRVQHPAQPRLRAQRSQTVTLWKVC